MNLSPDLIQVFKNAGHLLGLVSVGLKPGAGKIELRIDADHTRVFYCWRFTSKRGIKFDQAYCVMFGLLDRSLPGELELQARQMLDHWHEIAKVDERPNLDAPNG